MKAQLERKKKTTIMDVLKKNTYTHFVPPHPCAMLPKNHSSNTRVYFANFQHWTGERGNW